MSMCTKHVYYTHKDGLGALTQTLKHVCSCGQAHAQVHTNIHMEQYAHSSAQSHVSQDGLSRDKHK